MFYIILTILFVGAMVYDTIPGIVEIISQLYISLALLFIYLSLNNGSIRIYVESAEKNIPHSIKGFSIGVSLLKNTVIAILIGCVSFFVWIIAFFFFMKEWLNIVYDELTSHPFLREKGY